MDYAFIPGRSLYEKLMRQLFKDRVDTQLVDARGVLTVAQFIDHLETTAAITKPVGDLFITAHGNDRAWIQIDLDDQREKVTTYEVVENAVTSRSVQLPQDLNHNPDGSLASVTINFRGCRIGVSEPFVDKLKEAFGGDSSVTAPKHFHNVYGQSGVGSIEYLGYGFETRNKTAFPNKSAVVAAFTAEGFSFIGGSTVPDAQWSDWIPRNVGRGHRDSHSVYLNLGQTIAGLKRIRDAIEFRHDVLTFGGGIDTQGSMPPAADRLDTLRQALHDAADNTPGSFWADTHPLPMYKRYGHTDIDDFVDGLAWSFTWDAKEAKMVYVGRQHEYVVVVPMVNPPDLSAGNLIFNFIPTQGTGSTPVDDLLTSDDTLFYTA